MRIIAFSDIHGDRKALRGLLARATIEDVMLCAGDLSNFQLGLNTLLGFLNKAPCPVLIIHGNHESAEDLAGKCAEFPRLVFLHKLVYTLDGLGFVGWGGGGFSRQDTKLERFAAGLKKALPKKWVLLTHAPPFGTKLDSVGGEHCGSGSVRQLILELKPVLAVCGHIHETEGDEDILGSTRIINPGKKGRVITL